MSGSLTELAAIGAQDQYLFVDPEITFFKGDYKRHSNFSIEPLKNFFSPELRLGGTGICQIERNGDLVKDQYIVVKLPALQGELEGWEYVPEVGHAMIETISLEIGGHTFVEMTGEYMAMIHELENQPGKEVGIQVGKQVVAGGAGQTLRQYVSPDPSKDLMLYIPLMFWYNKTYQQVLPLISLAFHDVKIKIKLRSGREIVRWTQDDVQPSPESVNAVSQLRLMTDVQPHILTEYFYLDDDERMGFANNAQEYLIETVQYNGPTSVPAQANMATVRLDLNHPVHELLFITQTRDKTQITHSDGTYNTGRDYFEYTMSQQDDRQRDVAPIGNVQLTLNGHPRFSDLDGFYFYHIQNARLHSQKPNYEDGRFIHAWNFGIYPQDWKPSGSLNFSRIDTANLRVNFNHPSDHSAEVRVYARSRNVVRFRSGMAGLRYAN